MLKHKKFLLISLILPFFCLFSCAKPKEKYEVHKQEVDEPTHLTVDTKEFPSTMISGKDLPIDKLTITYNGNSLEWLGKDNKEIEKEGTFFLVANADYPTNSIVTSLTIGTNAEKFEQIFYIAHLDADTVYVSKTLKITITNDNAIKPWVWYTITAVVIFGVVGMVMFTRYYKNKRSGANEKTNKTN